MGVGRTLASGGLIYSFRGRSSLGFGGKLLEAGRRFWGGDYWLFGWVGGRFGDNFEPAVGGGGVNDAL